MEDKKMLSVGQRVKLLNKIDDGVDYCTIVYIEHDFDMGFRWIYLKSEDDALNVHNVPVTQDIKYWNIVESINDRLLYDVD